MSLDLRGLSVRRGGRTVVHDVHLTAATGTITALLGPNGAGKSSIVLAAAGIVRDHEGSIELDGQEILGLDPSRVRRAGLATVQEGHRVFRDISVADNLKIASLLAPKSERAEAVERVLAIFDELRALADRPGGALSGGQQQMLAIASALAASPRYLVIDEMSLGLAPIVVRRLVPALRDVAAAGVGILLIEQFTSVALELASSAAVLAQGRITLESDAATLAAQPALLASAYRLADAPNDGSRRTPQPNG